MWLHHVVADVASGFLAQDLSIVIPFINIISGEGYGIEFFG